MRKTYFSLYDTAVLSLMGALIFVLKTALKMPLHIPGHSGIFWVIPIVVGVGIVKKAGAGTYIGLVAGILSSFFGMGGFHFFDIFKYLIFGVTADIFAIMFAGHLDRPIVGFIIGATGNLSKMLVNYYIHTFLGVPATFIIIGLGFSSFSHFLFGGVGGIVAAIILHRLYKTGVVAKDGSKTID